MLKRPTPGWNPRRSVLAPFFLFDLIAVFVALSILSLAAIGISRNAIERDVKAQMESIAALKEQQVVTWADHLKHATEWIAGSLEIRSAVSALSDKSKPPQERQESRNFIENELGRITGLGDISQIALLSISGIVEVTTNPDWEGRDGSTQEYFIQGTRSTFISDIFPSEFLGQLAVVVAAPVTNPAGTTIAVITVYADLEALSNIMTQRSGLAQTGETFLTNDNRILITQLTNRPTKVFETQIFGEGVTRAIAGQTGVELFVDYREEPVIGAYRWLPELRLALIAKVDQSEAFAPVRDLSIVILSVAGGLLGLLLVAGWWSARQTATSIGSLTAYAERVRNGNFSVHMDVRGDNEVALVSRSIRSTVDRLLETQQQLSKLAAIVESSSDAIIGKTLDGIITSWNSGAEKIYGYSEQEAIGRPVSMLVAPDHPDEVPQILEKIRRGEMVSYFQTVRLRKNGQPIHVSMTVSPIKDSSDRIIGASTIARDITREKEAEAELNRLNASLIAANAELEAFSYSVSHDLRAPLRSIDGFSQALLEDYSTQMDETGQDFLNRVRAATQRMGHLIDDMLNLSRITRSEFNRGVVDLTTMGYDILKEINSREPERNVNISIAPDMIATGDKRLIEALLHNLLENAWKFTGKTHNARIEFGKTSFDGGIAYFVRDNGDGFDMKYADKLFNPFQRLHNVADFPGTGIGLAIARRVVNRHNGRIWAEGKPGEGATFYFTLDSKKGSTTDGQNYSAG